MFIFEKFKKVTVGEVVPAREGLRLKFIITINIKVTVGEVVPAREGLRLASLATSLNPPGLVEKVVPEEKD